MLSSTPENRSAKEYKLTLIFSKTIYQKFSVKQTNILLSFWCVWRERAQKVHQFHTCQEFLKIEPTENEKQSIYLSLQIDIDPTKTPDKMA